MKNQKKPKKSEEKKDKKNQKNRMYLGILTVLVIVVVFVIFAVNRNSVKNPQDDEINDDLNMLDDFAQCLTNKNAVLYGTEWCPHCTRQREAFGNSVEYITFVDCDINRDICMEKGITGYPTWIINEKKYVGTQQLSTLAEITGCEL